MGASKFFDIGGSGCAQNLHPTLRTARGDAHGRVAWTKKSVKFLACEVSTVNRQNVSLQISIVRTAFFWQLRRHAKNLANAPIAI
jgi:hypothetical protein